MVNFRDGFLRAIMLMLMVVSGVEGWGQIPNTYSNAIQFCTASELEIDIRNHYTFETGPYYGDPTNNNQVAYWITRPAYTSPTYKRTVAWVYLIIKDPGTLNLQIQGPSVDYCYWGPFSSKPNNSNQLTNAKLIESNAGSLSNISITINNTQNGQCYVFAFNYNYSNYGKIKIKKLSGNATTYCPLEPVLSATPDVLCEGQSLVLQETDISNADQYNWTGPDGATYSGRVWYRGMVTAAMSGTYSCVVIRGNEYGESKVDVFVSPVPTVTITTEDETTICEGESVTLHAEVRYIQPAPGDILCTDGSIVKPSEWATAGKVAKAVVFYVDKSGQHGWAVKKTDSQRTWGSSSDIPGLVNYTQWREAISDFAGYSNTEIIRNYGGSSYPAAWYVDFQHGWYLPSAGQLNVLYGELLVINESINLIGGYPFPTGNNATTYHIWSSTESSSLEAIAIQINNGTGTYESKSKNNYVREVVDF